VSLCTQDWSAHLVVCAAPASVTVVEVHEWELLLHEGAPAVSHAGSEGSAAKGMM
jgi:hypothetical protein